MSFPTPTAGKVSLRTSDGKDVDNTNPLPVSATFSGTLGSVDQGNAGTAAKAWWVQPTADGSTVSLPLPAGAAKDSTLGNLALKAQFPTTLGQTTKTGSLSVTIASDQATAAAPLFTSLVSDGTNAASIINTSPSSQYGLVVRNIPSGTQTVVGGSADNSANPSTKLSVISSRANAANPTWTEGNQAPLSVTLSGGLRVGGGSAGTADSNVVSVQGIASMVAVQTVRAKTASATLTSVAASATSGQLVAANTARNGLRIHNNSTADLYIKYGTTATTSTGGYTDYIPAGQQWVMDGNIYTGRIDAIWTAANGGASVTEL